MREGYDGMQMDPSSSPLPGAPPWFGEALANEPERSEISVAGASIELLTWGQRGRPGLLFLHGSAANADWWSFIAPFFAADWRVAAISWSGMGRSDWRDSYSVDGYLEEAVAGAEAAGLFDAGQPPLIVAHSFGAMAAFRAAWQLGERLSGVMSIDATPLRPRSSFSADRSFLPAERPVFPLREAAQSRFRLAFSDQSADPSLRWHLAYHAVSQIGPDRWSWAHDLDHRNKLIRDHIPRVPEWISGATCPLAFVTGDRSALVSDDDIAYTRSIAPPGTAFIKILDCGHHVMADQPLALVTTIRALAARHFRRVVT
ncbi:alpha/beta hydrolase [Sphingobium sp. Sx8-8]|uniref:alpha/beta fold hydrolase n=1 Tax=Sphingobium sp. Sx8-8 TaxID=2933617 RepID=UPI001F575FAD|nr:alpha/beta hydrolase [Sphingobium sp. Sx8-8]